MKTVLILGDCQSNGNNCLAHEVLNETAPVTWSLRFHKEFTKVFKWYLKHRKTHGVTDTMPTGNLESVVWHYYWEEEQKVSWPALLDIPNVVNFSLNGAHFIGHHNRLKKYLTNNPKPDHVLITDYTFSHIAHSFKWQGTRHVFERESYIESEWDPSIYPLEVHKKRLAGLAHQKAQSRAWHIKRHKRGFNMLIKFLDYHNIPWSVVRFGDYSQETINVFDSIMPNQINCIPYYRQYITENGENTKIKLQLQHNIAQKIQEYLKNY
jgi:hypothetical protein